MFMTNASNDISDLKIDQKVKWSDDNRTKHLNSLEQNCFKTIFIFSKSPQNETLISEKKRKGEVVLAVNF